MGRYVFEVPEYWVQSYEIEAHSPDEAREKLRAGNGEIVDGMFEFVETIQDSPRWNDLAAFRKEDH